MADEDAGEKSHEASPHRREQAREEGNVVKSQDLGSAAMLVIGLLTLWYMGNSLALAFGRITREHLGGEAWLRMDLPDILQQLVHIGADVGLAVLPILGTLVLTGVLVNLGQVGFLFLPQKLAMDWQRINPLSNAGRIFSTTSAVQLGFGMGKVVLVATIAAINLWGEREQLLILCDQEAGEIGVYLFSISFWTSLKIGIALLILAVFDYGYSYWKHEQDLMMSHQEMREEMKQQQGDPHVASRRKQVQRELAKGRLKEVIPKADVIVTNPTELAIALQYDPDTMPAPVVLAKGAGVLAQQIRRLALENAIAVVERKELARALYANVDVNSAVPAEQYAAVAEVIRYVYQLKGKKLPGQQAA
ncbi:EscU/YscU/HrcU family type III secretion system export apparatus switch protein [Anatilimnocola floriformis]|uniref:EscU/YscU/HrcU family type III secretion system export apparatus switch protein n=1 Tax=Anatilimnocola floriformis TaxID=2948575 RepID=UPI0020C47631|nr:flagellar type III secretion system protein FlhB [Anatilimnocola floriformis]